MFVGPGQSTSLARLPYLFALTLAGGSLVVYMIGALVSSFGFGSEGKTDRSFNLGIPLLNRPPAELFGISMAAAQTTFSTVFLVFLADAGKFGFHFLYCPLAFAAGNWLMLQVYRRIAVNGYLDDSSLSGLVPYFAYQLTRNSRVAYAVLVMCIVPIVALLALELNYASAYLDYLVRNALLPATSWTQIGYMPKLPSFVFFAFFMTLLLGYVFIGGFRAVIASDVWQYRIMFSVLALACVSVIVLLLTRWQDVKWNNLPSPPSKVLIEFYTAITLINLFQPLCFATTWQRFRAFRDHATDFSFAVKQATVKVSGLWAMLILIGVGVQLLSPAVQSHEYVADFLDRIAKLGPWFHLFVFPLLIMAGFSGMYSSSDTCVSSLLYLTETNRAWRMPHQLSQVRMGRHYYWVMTALFVLTLATYGLVRTRTSQGPTEVALMLFSNAVILAPIVLVFTRIAPTNLQKHERHATIKYIFLSMSCGQIVYWVLALVGPRAGIWAPIGGLVAATVPVCALLARKSPMIAEAANG